MAMPPLFHFLQPKPGWPGVLAYFACFAARRRRDAGLAEMAARAVMAVRSAAQGEGESLVSMPDAVQPHRWGNDGQATICDQKYHIKM